MSETTVVSAAADLQNIITDFERKYFEGLRARSTLAALERDPETRLHYFNLSRSIDNQPIDRQI